MLGEAPDGLPSVAPKPCLWGPAAPWWQGPAALHRGGKGVIIALETL